MDPELERTNHIVATLVGALIGFSLSIFVTMMQAEAHNDFRATLFIVTVGTMLGAFTPFLWHVLFGEKSK